jgi:Tfp pilus assembly protein PilO
MTMDIGANINIKQLTEKLIHRKDFIFYVIVLFVALLIARSVNGHLTQRITELQTQIERQKKVNESVATLLKLQGRFNEYQKNMPEDINAFTALDKINEVASKTGTRLISVTPAEARDRAVYLEYPFSIRLEADYAVLADFVKRLEDMKMFRILDLDIVGSASQGETAKDQMQRLSVNMSILGISLKK